MTFFLARALVIQTSLPPVMWHWLISKLNWNVAAIVMVSSLAAFTAVSAWMRPKHVLRKRKLFADRC